MHHAYANTDADARDTNTDADTGNTNADTNAGDTYADANANDTDANANAKGDTKATADASPAADTSIRDSWTFNAFKS